jgi:preprotein translocase subunit SecG
MVILLTIIHILVCLFLIIVVLLQSGKAADLAGAFGGMGSQTAFGPRGAATILSKATTIAAGLFMVTSLSLSIFATRNSGGASTVLDQSAPSPAQKKAPAAPKSGGSVTLTPEGGDPSKGITVPIPSAEELKKAGRINVPAGVPKQDQKGSTAKQPQSKSTTPPVEKK